jgi:uncharacterized membrane protein YbhN (UPF0104 family)
MIYLFFWVLFGVASALIASSKNKNTILWFFLGVMIGPFALAIIAIIDKELSSEDILRKKVEESELQLRIKKLKEEGVEVDFERNPTDQDPEFTFEGRKAAFEKYSIKYSALKSKYLYNGNEYLSAENAISQAKKDYESKIKK